MNDAGQVSLSVGSYGHQVREGELSLAEFMRAAAGHGVGAVELCDRTIIDPQAAVAAAHAYGLGMPSVALRNDFTVDPARVRVEVDRVLEWLPVVASMGSGLARVWVGASSTSEQARGQVVECFDEIVPVALDGGTTLVVETFAGLSSDVDFVGELCARYPAGSVGVCLDFGNFASERRIDLIRAFAPLAAHVHVKSYEFSGDHETTVPLDLAVDTMLARGYEGQWVVEYEGAPPYPAGIDKTLAVLRRHGVLPLAS